MAEYRPRDASESIADNADEAPARRSLGEGGDYTDFKKGPHGPFLITVPAF